jgi:ABC-2 type transport system permease protein
VLLGSTSGSVLVENLIPLAVIGIITVPMGIWLFVRAEQFAKKTGRLKRTG